MSLASGVSRQHLIAIRDGKKIPKLNTLKKIVLGLRRVEAGDVAKRIKVDLLLAWARRERDRIGLRKLAVLLRTDHSTLAQTLNETRPVSLILQQRLDVAFRKMTVSIRP
jgi:transcriptional regulator with XRE-family HTH domain